MFQLTNDLFSANSDLYSNSTTNNLFQSTNDKDLLFNSNLRTNGTAEKSELFLRDNGPSLPKGVNYKDHFSSIPASRGHLNEIFSSADKNNPSYQRLSDKEVRVHTSCMFFLTKSKLLNLCLEFWCCERAHEFSEPN